MNLLVHLAIPNVKNYLANLMLLICNPHNGNSYILGLRIYLTFWKSSKDMEFMFNIQTPIIRFILYFPNYFKAFLKKFNCTSHTLVIWNIHTKIRVIQTILT